jgi:hypothetical protein
MRYIFLSGFLLLAWCRVAYAAIDGEHFGAQLTKIPASSWLLVVLLAGIPGLFGVLGKLDRGEIELGRRAWFKVAYDLLGSIIMGFLAFFVCELARAGGMQMPDVALALSIAAGGYGGAKLADRFLAKRGDELVDGVKLPGN